MHSVCKYTLFEQNKLIDCLYSGPGSLVCQTLVLHTLCPLYTKVPSELGVTYVWKMQKLAPTRE